MNLKMVKKITYCMVIGLTLISLYYLKSMTILILISIIIAYVINPFVKYMTLKGMNKRVAVLVSLMFLLTLIIFIFFFILPGMMRDILGAINNMDQYGGSITNFINNFKHDNMPQYLKVILDKNILMFEGMVVKYLNEIFKEVIDFGMELPTYILIPIFVYYFLMDADFFFNIIKKLIPIKMRNKAIELGRECDNVMGGFVRSQIILSIIVSALTFLTLMIFKIKYPIIIALIGGVTNIIPYFGPLIGMVPAVLVALTQSANKAIIICIALLIIQQFESSIIAPKLMGESIGIHPVFIMILLLIGGEYFGALGLILSIPIGGVIKVTWNYVVRNLY